MKGWREEMEDFHSAQLNLQSRDMNLFGVFDGHGGKEVAKYASESLHKVFLNQDEFYKGQYDLALKAAFLKLDYDIKYTANLACRLCGSTAVVCLLVDKVVYCANVGDSRAVLCRNGKAVDLSRDHKPRIAAERTRIERAGGKVHQNRVNGLLSMSRALGDYEFKMGEGAPEEQQVRMRA